MKLIRLVSKDVNETVFTSYLKDNVKIQPDAKIALKSLSMDLQDKNIVVEQGVNDTFRVKMGTKESNNANLQDEYKTITIPPGSYTTQEMVSELTSLLNSVLSSPLVFDLANNNQAEERTDLGFQWKVDVDTAGELSIGFNRSDIVQAEPANMTLFNMEESNTPNTIISNVPGGPRLDDYQSTMLWQESLCQGGFRAKFKIEGQNSTAPIDNGDLINYGQFECGLTNSKFVNVLIPENLILSAGCDFFQLEDTYYKSPANTAIFTAVGDDIDEIEVNDWVYLDKYQGNYPVNNTQPADLEITFNPSANAAQFIVNQDIYIQFIELGVEQLVKRTVVAINPAQGTILLNGFLSIQNPCTNIAAFKQGQPLYTKVVDFDNLTNEVTLQDVIDTQNTVWFTLKQNFMYFRTPDRRKNLILNTDTNKYYKLTSGTEILFSRGNPNDEGAFTNTPCAKIQMIYINPVTSLQENINIYTEEILGNIDYQNPLYAGMVAALDTIADGTSQLNLLYSLRGNNNPFTKTLDDGSIVPQDQLIVHDHLIKAVEPSIVTLDFTLNALTKKLLGYKNDQYVQNIVAYTFTAEYPLLQNQIESDVMVEIMNIPLECYDSERGGRQNVIYAVNRGEFESNILDNRFDSRVDYPIFMNISNAAPQNLNQFNIRITAQGQPLKLKESTKVSLILLLD